MKFLVILICLAFASPSFSQNSPAASADLVIHLLDYLAKDYGGAVQDGKVISQGEYDEQVEFSEIVRKNSSGFPKLAEDTNFSQGITTLQEMIREMKPASEVSLLARKLQQDAIRLAGIEVSPKSAPDLKVGASLFQTNCISCHGAQGKGDGPAGAGLDPKPANFHDPELVWNSAPYKFFNTIRLGVPGTGMAPFPHLSDAEVWSLAFYLKSLPYTESRGTTKASGLNLKEISSLTDSELAERLGGRSPESEAIIATVRSNIGDPEQKDPLDIAEELLTKSVAAASAGNYDEANVLGLRSYLEGIEPIEPKMKANVPGFVEQVEGLMSQYREALSSKSSVNVLEAKKGEIVKKLREARTFLSQNRMSAGIAFTAAFSIFLREGFEAVLIIVVLLSILKAMDQPKAAKWVHAGWIAAVAIGVLAWFMSGLLLSMSGFGRELMEGSISLLAVAVLLYVGFWLHRYSEMKKWRGFLEENLREGLTNGSYVGLMIISFMAVFREAFEVVLFLRAIWIDLDSSGQLVASGGIFSSLLVLVVLSYLATKESQKLPLGKLFQVCSWTMIALAFVLAGKGVHSLQEAGALGISSLPWSPRIDLLGLYPSVQTLTAQLIVVLIFAIVLLKDRQPSRSSESH